MLFRAFRVKTKLGVNTMAIMLLHGEETGTKIISFCGAFFLTV